MVPQGILLLAAFALSACTTSPTTPLNMQWKPETQAKIITQSGVAAQCIAPVAVYEINGQLTNVSRQGFYLEAGEYRIKAQGLVNTAACPVLYIPPNYVIPPIEMTFEPGLVYYLGMDHSSTRITDWRVILWRVERQDGTPLPVVIGENRIEAP